MSEATKVHAETCAINLNARHGCTCDPCRVHGGDRRKDAPGMCDRWDSDPYALRRCDFFSDRDSGHPHGCACGLH